MCSRVCRRVGGLLNVVHLRSAVALPRWARLGARVQGRHRRHGPQHRWHRPGQARRGRPYDRVYCARQAAERRGRTQARDDEARAAEAGGTEDAQTVLVASIRRALAGGPLTTIRRSLVTVRDATR